MKIGILTAIWGRPRLTELVLGYYESMPINMRVLVDSPDNCALIASSLPKWNMTSAPNEPLSDKWLHGLQWMREWQDRWEYMDAVIIVGSDDLITPSYIDACRYLIAEGADYVYLPGCYFYDAPTKRMIWGQAERLGLGRCISRRLLDRMDWQPWPEGLTHGLDGAMWERVQAIGDVRHVRLDSAMKEGYIGMDIKTGENIWSFDHIRENIICYDVEPEPVLRKHFPGVADELLNW